MDPPLWKVQEKHFSKYRHEVLNYKVSSGRRKKRTLKKNLPLPWGAPRRTAQLLHALAVARGPTYLNRVNTTHLGIRKPNRFLAPRMFSLHSINRHTVCAANQTLHQVAPRTPKRYINSFKQFINGIFQGSSLAPGGGSNQVIWPFWTCIKQIDVICSTKCTKIYVKAR
jgi:hypothetical protein